MYSRDRIRQIQIRSGWGLARALASAVPRHKKPDIHSDEAKTILAAAEQDFDQAITTNNLRAGSTEAESSDLLEFRSFALRLETMAKGLGKQLAAKLKVSKSEANDIAYEILLERVRKIDEPYMFLYIASAVNSYVKPDSFSLEEMVTARRAVQKLEMSKTQARLA